MIYLFVFCISSLIIYLGETAKLKRLAPNNNRYSKNDALNLFWTKKVLIIIALFIPIFLATFRHETVGIDVYTYMKPLYLCTKRSSDIADFFVQMKNDTALQYMDYGYGFIAYVACKFFGTLNGLFFVNELLCMLPVYFGIKNINSHLSRNKIDLNIPVWLGMFIWYCCFYNNSLNQVRQLIVCAILFYAFTLFLNKKYVITVLLFCFSLTLHISAIIFIYIVLTYLICKSKHNFLRYLLAFLLIIFLIFSIDIFYFGMNILKNLGLVPEKYQGEIFDVEYGERNINLSWLFIGLVMIFSSGFFYYKNRQNIFARFLFFVSLSFLSLFNISSYFSSFGRIQLYFMIYATVAIPSMSKVIKGNIIGNVSASSLLSILVVVAYWIVAVYLLDYTGTIPYKFM